MIRTRQPPEGGTNSSGVTAAVRFGAFRQTFQSHPSARASRPHGRTQLRPATHSLLMSRGRFDKGALRTWIDESCGPCSTSDTSPHYFGQPKHPKCLSHLKPRSVGLRSPSPRGLAPKA